MARSTAGTWRSNNPTAGTRHRRTAAPGATWGKRAALAVLLLGGMAGGPSALPAAPPDGGMPPPPSLVAPAQPRASRAHIALNTAIECNRRGEYEQADVLFRQALAGQDDLSPSEQQELVRWVQTNAAALQARREGSEQLAAAEQALRAGRPAEAAETLKGVLANQYLTAADKQRAQALADAARPRGGKPPANGGAPDNRSLNLARSKLQQARAMLAQGNYDAAQQLAVEAQGLNAVYRADEKGNVLEDTPAKVLEDIYKARSDPKGLLTAARAALKSGDLDRAESLAQEASRHESSWSLHLWGDSPAQVLKEVQAARAKGGAGAAHAGPRSEGSSTTPKQPGHAAADKPTLFGSMKGMFGSDRSETTTANAAPPTGATPPAGSAVATEKARALLQQGRQALKENKLDEANDCAIRARELAPSLGWWDDTPDKLQADVQRALGRRPAAEAVAPKKPAAEVAVKVDGSKEAAKDAPEDPRALLRRGRALFAAGQYDEAARCANRARQASTARWGIFEDSPDKLQQDIDEARAQHDRDESVKLMAEARKHFEQGDYDEASRLAYRAQKLHGPYSWWDLGDRPMKLLAEIETARTKKGLPPGHGDSLAARDKDRPADGAEPPQAPKARQMLLEARVALSGGDMPRAEALLRQVAVMGALTRAEDQAQLDALRRDIVAARLGKASGVVQASPSSPAAPAPQAAPPMPAAPAPAMTAAGDPAKMQAQQLLAECRQLQRQGRLIEARQKALQAQAARAAFGPTEDSPEQALIQLSALGYKQIDSLMQQAADLQATAAVNPTNRARAEQNLRQARELAAGFGFDTALVDARLQVVAQAGMAAPGAPAGEVRVASSQAPAAGSPGVVLLAQAREMLRKGDTPQARKMAEDVYKGPYGMQDQAEAMLRSIDAEEFAQQRLAAERTFEAGMSAYRRKEYAQAAAILRTLNPRLLEDAHQATLKNVFALPEMQPSQLAQLSSQEPAPGAGVAQASDQAPVPLPATPAAAATPAPDQDVLKITQAMQDVKFQQLRQEGLEVQREAAERFKAGDTARAIDILQEYEASLSTTQLDADRVALLRRPIESRLLTFKTLKAQRDFEGEALKKHQSAKDFQTNRALTERNKQQKVAELMQQYSSFYKEGKYKEAEMYASAAFELDPDNVAAGAAVQIARVHRRQVEYQGIKDRKEEYNLNAWNDAEDPGPYVSEKVGVHFDKDTTIRNIRERKDARGGIIPPPRSDKEKEIEQLLTRPVNLAFNDAPLGQVLDDLRAWHGLNIVTDQPALDGEGISLSRPVTIKLDNVSLKSALNLLLHQVHLTYVIKDEVLQITTEANAKGKLVTATYQVADLITPINDYALPNSANLMKALEKASNPQAQPTAGAPVTPYQGAFSLPGGSQASGSQGSSMWGTAGSAGGPTPVVIKSQTQTMEDALIKLITNTVQPHTWDSMGGQGHVDYFPLAMALVINQTPDIQEQIADLLAALRRLQDQEVSVEVRFISVAEGFYERIGVDFNVNFKTDANQKYGPQITSGQFQQAGYVNNFNPSQFIAGLTPAGTLTSDLNIPLQTSSFGMAIPPFGGFPNMPGLNGGIDLGLAFLSDIQVFLFMEAAQGDQRTNVMQAPKLTLSNGQTAQIFVQDQQFFVTNVEIIQQGGQLAFVPQNQNFATGVSMTIQATISADRRFVRISFSQIQLSNLASAVVPLFPIVTPIIPLLEGGFQGNPVLFTQFIQQPVFDTVTVSTTVTVPDGGTVVMGGLKRLSEGRNEFGPPVLSKIPYLNRLFKNVGYGREVESLLIMVTPRVIINEEEEYRQTGVGVGGPGGAEAGAVGPPGLTGPPPAAPAP